MHYLICLTGHFVKQIVSLESLKVYPPLVTILKISWFHVESEMILKFFWNLKMVLEIFCNQNSILKLFSNFMTYTFIVWNQFQNWIQIMKNFQNHFQIPKDFQNSFLIQNGIRKNTKWFQMVDRLLGSPRPWLKGYLFKKMILLDMLNDTTGFRC